LLSVAEGASWCDTRALFLTAGTRLHIYTGSGDDGATLIHVVR
jgi:hypothetical protein